MAPEITSPVTNPETAVTVSVNTAGIPVKVRAVGVSDVTVKVSATVMLIVCVYEALEPLTSVTVIVLLYIPTVVLVSIVKSAVDVSKVIIPLARDVEVAVTVLVSLPPENVIALVVSEDPYF